MKCICFRATADDSIVIRHVAPERLAELMAGGLTETESLTVVANSHSPNKIEGDFTWQIIADTDLPGDRYFRNAWEWEE